jgi:hypothetical protein
METKKILKKQKKAEQKLKDRLAKEALTQGEKPPVEDDENSDVENDQVDNRDDVHIEHTGAESKEEKKEGGAGEDKYFSQL